MAYFDRGRLPTPDHDPTKEIQFAIDAAVKQLGDGLFRMADAAMEVVKELLKEVVDKIVGFITNPEEMLEDIGEWVLNIPKLIGGLLSSTIIPGLDASKIVSGLFSIGRIDGLQANLDALDAAIGAIPGAQELIDKICNALGIPGTGHNASDVFTALSNIPGGNIVGAIAASLISGLLNITNIPGLDASKIVSGTISQAFLNITSIAASIVTGALSPLNIPGLDGSKITSGQLDKLRFPDITADMSTDMGKIVDNVINSFSNGSSTGQLITDIPTVLGKLPTYIYNMLGGNNYMTASVDQAKAAMEGFAKTVSDQGVLINEIKGQLDGGDAGFSANIAFRLPETTIFNTPTATSSGTTTFSYTLPPWFVLGTDWIDGVVSGGGGGGDGTGDVFLQGPGLDGWSSKLTVNGVDRTALYGSGGNGGSGPNPLWSGEAMPDLMYLDILYPGASSGSQPGSGGNAGNATPAGDRHGGQRAQWDSFSVQPTSATITGVIGDGGAGGNAGFGGFAGKKGGAGIAHVRARKAMPASFTSQSIPQLPTCWKLNTGVALTNTQRAAAIWTRNPPNGASGGHMLMIRGSTNFSHYVYLKVWYTGGVTNWEMGRVVSGTKTVFPGKTGTIPSAIPFNAFSISSDNVRTFTVAINDTPFDSYNDTSGSSPLGPLYMTGGYATSDSTSPGSIAQFVFGDTGTPARITSNVVATSQTVSGTAYTNLATVGPSVSLVVPQSGEVTVTLTCDGFASTTGQQLFMGVELSGANTVAASDANSCSVRSGVATAGATATVIIHFTGLTPGTTTFLAKYRTTAGTPSFANRRMTVRPEP